MSVEYVPAGESILSPLQRSVNKRLVRYARQIC